MLDRWSTPQQHRVSTEVRERTLPDGKGGFTTERDYRSACTCGWRSLEFVRPMIDQCPVLAALQTRIKGIERDSLIRDKWRPLP